MNYPLPPGAPGGPYSPPPRGVHPGSSGYPGQPLGPTQGGPYSLGAHVVIQNHVGFEGQPPAWIPPLAPSSRTWLALGRQYPRRAALLLWAGALLTLGLTFGLSEATGIPSLLLLGPRAGAVLAALLGGYFWLRRDKRGGTPSSSALELQLLNAAYRAGGRLSVVGAAHTLGLPLEEVEGGLSALASQGHATPDLDLETGRLTYTFPDILAELSAGHSAEPPRRLP